MHILFVTGEYPPMSGGVGAYTAELATSLAALGVQVSIFTDKRADVGCSQHLDSAMRVYPLVRNWGPMTIAKIRAHAASIQADCIHIQYQTAAFNMNPSINLAPHGWRRWQTLSRNKCSNWLIAWTYHDLRYPYLLPKIGDPARHWITRLPAWASDLVFVTNQEDADELAQHDIHSEVIPIGSNIPPRFLSNEERAGRRTARGYGPEDVVLAYFGFLNRSKGGLTLIRTLARLTSQGISAHLLMIGEQVGASDPSNFAYLQEVESLISELGLGDRVQWTGFQSATEVSADLNACDVLLLPYTDGVSLRRGSLMAGLTHGCAIVTTQPATDIPQLADGQAALLCPAGDHIATADAVTRIMASPHLQQTLRSGARRCGEQFDWATIARRHVDQYEMHMPRATDACESVSSW